jgi:hypothetical protein
MKIPVRVSDEFLKSEGQTSIEVKKNAPRTIVDI